MSGPISGAPLRAVVLYARGKAKSGDALDDDLIKAAFGRVGMEAETVNLADLTFDAVEGFRLLG